MVVGVVGIRRGRRRDLGAAAWLANGNGQSIDVDATKILLRKNNNQANPTRAGQTLILLAKSSGSSLAGVTVHHS